MHATHTIHVADDSIPDQELIRRALKMAGVPVRLQCTNNGEDTLAALGLDAQEAPTHQNQQKHPSLPNLLLLDLNLPRLSGRDVLRALRDSEAHRHLPVVILSSSRHRDDVLWCYQNGCNGYVQKSEFQTFLRDIARLADFWLSAAVLPE